ncbi:MAG: hypothetical protein KGS48_01605 [Bacteroidetes bacterium]|nr:hypothetical protein [Bacteroidota bacterium]
MRCIFLLACFFQLVDLFSQKTLVPGPHVIQKKWLKSQDYAMKWYVVRDSARFEIGEVHTQIAVDERQVCMVTNVLLHSNRTPWIDSSLAQTLTLAPIFHRSSNAQRDIELHYGKEITGYYLDKSQKKKTLVQDTVNTGFFDSNLYPVLIGWLRLRKNDQKKIAIYDYNPSATSGLTEVWIQSVKKGVVQTQKSGKRKVWVVQVSDSLGTQANGSSFYFFDKKTRQLWRQEIQLGDRIMHMERVE